MADTQLELIDNFSTTLKANSVFCHQEFLEKLAAQHQSPIARRAALLLQRLAVDERRLHYKATRGVNRGWRRSRLGGNQGSHFYAWWAPRNAAPLKDGAGFEEAPDGALFLRDIRHHDDHSPLFAQSFNDHYLPVSVMELRREEYAPAPWTPAQARFGSARQPVRLLKGHPGSGKTTALWHAVDVVAAQRILYVTYSSDLAALARGYFDRFCSAAKSYHVVTYPALIGEIAGAEAPGAAAAEDGRKRFLYDLAPFARSLGPWADDRTALYDELHAHLAGAAVPAAAGRFRACSSPRVPDKIYLERRSRFIGQAAASAALDAAGRLERMASTSLANRYFPQVAAAWEAARLLNDGKRGIPDQALFDFDCIAVDECQDLTPIEAFVLVKLGNAINKQRRTPPFVLFAGDEAQTVRPTDFEWGWLSDLLHEMLYTPAEFHLGVNLRSPRRIAELVNRAWDLYGHLYKHDRPRGTGAAEIDDDAPDQVLYCTATPGEELSALLTELSTREGLALVTLDESPPDFIPPAIRASVLTPREIKGLDFHSVCVLDAGRYLETITRFNERWRLQADIQLLRKRLQIDRLRVAISRPSERLFWLDINPNERIVAESLRFLNGDGLDAGISTSVPQAILRTLEEEDLDVEERVQRCQSDARQYLSVRPEIAWSRAQQAVTFLGRIGAPAAITDEAVRRSAYLTLSEICFALAFRGVRLPAELGRPDLFHEASKSASMAGRPQLGAIIDVIARVQRAPLEERLPRLGELAGLLPQHIQQVEPWLRIEISTKVGAWLNELEGALQNGRNAAILRTILPPFYKSLDLPDADARIDRLRQRVVQILLKDKRYAEALGALADLPERLPKLEAACHEKLGNYRAAAEAHIASGNFKDALSCYRSIPDFDASLEMVRKAADHPAAESLEWIARLRSLVRERPDKFPKVVTAAEKKMLEEVLEQALGVTRKKPAPRTAVKRPASPTTKAKRPKPKPKTDFF